ncbi:unnamed protein product [Rotaria sp. Silwood1]|nr:unnamed protein product [Rotaria sp. Silwood1]CAF4663672.1 unnamed protein product [Rotaria sp. Silwood1]
MAYVYDYSTLQQYVYVNGVQDASNTNRGPYKGTQGDMTIGTNGVFAGMNYWDGCLDQISYFSRAKSATEVLQDATLTIFYPFNNSLLDYGPLGINGTGINYQYATIGRVNESLNLSSNPSYVQATGLVYLGTVGNPYSLAIWIMPITIAGGTIIHVSSNTSGIHWSMPMLGLTNAGNIIVQSCSVNSSLILTGPAINVGVWTHLAVTYQSTDGLRLWVNGTQYGAASGAYTFSAAGVPVTATLGFSPSIAGPCSSSTIATGQYTGLLDEFYLFSRELSSTDVWNLANP